MALNYYNTLATLLFLLVSSYGTYAAQKQSLGASFIFGDSLVDAGNNNYLSTLSRANMTPNGIDFKASGGNPTGRFTNGRTISDIVGEQAGNGYSNRLLQHNKKEIDKLLGKSNGRELIMKRSIFSISVGSNDFLNNYLLPLVSVGARVNQSPDAFVDEMINHFRIQLTRLYEMDARKFVVSNVGPIGCIPYQRAINQLNEDECSDLANKLAVQYNGRLKDLLAELNDNLPGANFVLANVYDLVMELITNYAKYGLRTGSSACCGFGGQSQLAGIIPCGPTSSLCSDRYKHVFWDAYHPSEAANLILAKQLLDGDNRYVSPFNVRQLSAL
ncbi:GDSL esterase/lipase [Arachis hypogaea]|nr:GDSL esterase/lipase [Arachis hypogaea]